MKTEPDALSLENFFKHFDLVIEVLKNQQSEITYLKETVERLNLELVSSRERESFVQQKLDNLDSNVHHLRYAH